MGSQDHTRQVVIAATWGDPFRWREAEYVVDVDGHTERVNSVSSLPAIVKAEGLRGKVSRILVYVQETLLAGDRTRPSQAGMEYIPRSYEPVHSNMSYPELMASLREAISSFAQTKLEDAGVCDQLGRCTVEAVVAPGVGPFSYLDYDGTRREAFWLLEHHGSINMFTYYEAFMALHLSSILLAMSPESSVRLAVDLTHGVNYTVAAAYRAAVFAARVRAAAYNQKVEIVLYNSEPFREGVPLRVWRVRKETVPPKMAASRLVYSIAAYSKGGLVKPERLVEVIEGKYSILGGDELSNLKKERARVVKERITNSYRTFVSFLSSGPIAAVAVVYGAPLLLLEAGKIARNSLPLEESVRIVATIADAIEHLLVEKGRRVVRDSKSTRIYHLLALDRNLVKAFLAEVALSLYSADALENSRHYILLYHPAIWATPETLRFIVNNYIAGPAHLTASHEISKIEEALNSSMSQSSSDLYSRIADACRNSTRRYNPAKSATAKNCTFSDRVFAAHAGLNNDLVDVACLKIEAKLEPAVGYSEDFMECITKLGRRFLRKLAESLNLEKYS